MGKINYAAILTEKNNPATKNIDEMSTKMALKAINREDAKVAGAVARQIPNMDKAVNAMVQTLKSGNKIFLVGAGTSGRLGVLEAAECPPTFNTPPALIQAIMAGGRASVFKSKEGAEDKGEAARSIIKKKVCPGDTVIGIAASGVTPFAKAALATAKKIGARTVLITCHPKIPKDTALIIIALNTGPEVIAGSTRLKAATATKMVLNSLTVATMVRIGKVYGNQMVDLQPKSNKLRERAERLIQTLGQVSPARAKMLLQSSGGNAKTAILMARKNISKDSAAKLLALTGGQLKRALRMKEIKI